ncbi:MAG: ethylbenzene dehydrogenase-related protein [Thermodesulfobacteriota bacterium]|nr:ethylbenzene dehydrogenase-related protein [Thermodesulfobacteriota bacterium]
MEQITSKKVSAATQALLKADNSMWQSGKTMIETTATPLANQPSPYIKGVYEEDKIGAVKKFEVKTLHNGEWIFFYFEWATDRPNETIEDINTFPDGVAILYPMRDIEKTPIKEMGTQEYPTNAWYWRPDFDGTPKNQICHGLSTSLYTDKTSLKSDSYWKNGKWHVVMGRPLKAKRQGEDTVDLQPGQKIGIGFGIWEGNNGERGGVKAFSKEWRELVVQQ